MKNSASIKPAIKLFVFISILAIASNCKEDSSPSTSNNNPPTSSTIPTAGDLTWTASGFTANTTALSASDDLVVAGTYDATEAGNIVGSA